MAQNEPLKALIVEDEHLAREELIYLVNKNSDIEIVASFDDGLEAFKYLQSNKVDIVFLDINIPSIDGMLLARNIHQFSEKPHIVFITAYKEFAVDAFELEAFDYLLKPLNEARLCGLLNKLSQLAAAPASTGHLTATTQASTINLMQDNRIVITPIESIYYAVADEKVTRVYTIEQELIANMPISDVIEKLPADRFFHCHRSYLVNLAKIKQITPGLNSTYQLDLFDQNAQIPVSRGKIKAFRQLMNL